MITMSRDRTTGDYFIADSETGETRRYPDQPSWLYASLVELLRGSERMEASLDRLQCSYERRTEEVRP